MRLSSTVVSRPEYYDRNPALGLSRFGGLIAENTAETEGWTYTVPANRKAQLGILYHMMLGEIAAATAVTTNQTTVRVKMTPTGGASADVFTAAINSASYAAGHENQDKAALNITMEAGDLISATHEFQGTAAGAGRVRFDYGFGRTEFDA